MHPNTDNLTSNPAAHLVKRVALPGHECITSPAVDRNYNRIGFLALHIHILTLKTQSPRPGSLPPFETCYQHMPVTQVRRDLPLGTKVPCQIK